MGVLSLWQGEKGNHGFAVHLPIELWNIDHSWLNIQNSRSYDLKQKSYWVLNPRENHVQLST